MTATNEQDRRVGDLVQVTRDGGVATVKLCRPPYNLITRPMMDDLRESFLALAEERDINAVVFAAEGDRVFCGGLDLGQRLADSKEGTVVAHDASSVSSLIDHTKPWRETQWAIRRCPVPVVAAVEGGAVGGGFGLVGVCDVIFASDRAWFALTEIDVGLLGGASKALRMVGPYKARSMFFTGDRIPAAEFYRRGAIEELTPPGQAEARAVAFAQKLAAKSPIGLRLAKESILRIEDMSLEDAYRTENDYSLRLATFHDSREAMSAFMEKREPRWTWS